MCAVGEGPLHLSPAWVPSDHSVALQWLSSFVLIEFMAHKTFTYPLLWPSVISADNYIVSGFKLAHGQYFNAELTYI